MKIIFLNTWEATRAAELRAYLEGAKTDTDIFCLQEANPDMQKLADEVFSGWNKTLGGKYTIKPGTTEQHHMFQANYSRPDIKLIATDIVLHGGTDIGFGLYTGYMVGGINLHILNIHGMPWPGKFDTPARLAQSRAFIEHMKGKEGIQIIGGDFNILPETESIRMFKDQGYADLIKDFSIRTTRNRFAWEKYPGNELYYSDYVFIKHAKVVDFAVPALEISDHLPMLLDIEV